MLGSFFIFIDTATTEIYTLSLHDALPISRDVNSHAHLDFRFAGYQMAWGRTGVGDRKSTRLNSSHSQISYAVFCLKKKNPWEVARPNETVDVKLNCSFEIRGSTLRAVIGR